MLEKEKALAESGEGSPITEKETKQINRLDERFGQRFEESSKDSSSAGTLAGRRILVTAGPTWMPIDSVRHIGNLSSGRTGVTVARELAARGARVTLLLGPVRAEVAAADRQRLEVTDFVTFDDLHRLIRERVGERGYDGLVHAAAVSDYRPVEEVRGKLSSGEEELVIRLRPTPKIVDEVKELDSGILLVKFKLEVGRSKSELLEIARRSQQRSRADLMVANDLSDIAPGRHRAFVTDGDTVLGEAETTEELAGRLADVLALRLAERPVAQARGGTDG